MLEQEIAEPEREAIHQDDVGIRGGPLDGIRQCQRLHDSAPVGGPFGAMALHASHHFGVVAGQQRSDVADPLRVCC